jgi:hypothetical protein
MNYSIIEAISIIERTPLLLEQMLSGLSDEWIISNEGAETWSPYDVVGHLVHGERTDWIARLEIVLSDTGDKKFAPFDRFAQFKENEGKTINDLLKEFKNLREKNIGILKSKNITEKDFDRTGIHPKFGNVTLKNLLATWIVHDLNHLAQIARVMAHQYRTEVGPWKEYLRILNQ